MKAASPVLNGGDEETGLRRPRLVATQLECDRGTGCVHCARPGLWGGRRGTGAFTRKPTASSVRSCVAVRRESGVEECGNTLGVQAPNEPLELSVVDHSTR